MLYLLNENFKVIGKGDEISPKKKTGEFILHHSLPLATVQEVAKANAVKFVNKDKVEELISKIETVFQTMEIKVMSKDGKNELELKCEAIVKEGFEQGKDEDAIQVALVSAGLKFKAAASTYKRLSEALGFKITTKDRHAQIVELVDKFKPKAWDNVQKAADAIVKSVKDTTPAQAIASLRKICKEAEVEFPKKPKGEKGSPRGFKPIVFKWMLENRDATKKDLHEFMVVNDKGQRSSLENTLWMALEFARAYAS